MGRPENLENYQEWKSWSQAKKTLLLNELDTAKEEAKQARRAGNKDKACVFFIGEQKADRLETFYASDSRLNCSIIGNIVYLKYELAIPWNIQDITGIGNEPRFVSSCERGSHQKGWTDTCPKKWNQREGQPTSNHIPGGMLKIADEKSNLIN